MSAPFLGVAWGWPTTRGRQTVHVVEGPSSTEVRALCRNAVMVWPTGPGLAAKPAYGYEMMNRPMVTCGTCRKAVAARRYGRGRARGRASR